MKMKFKFGRIHFLLSFCTIVLILFFVKCIHPDVLTLGLSDKGKETDSVTIPPIDSILLHSHLVDSLILRPRASLCLLDKQGNPVKNRVTSVTDFNTVFPDLNDVQLATAQRLGIPQIADRDEAVHRKKDLVYIGDNPFYDIKPLHHSIPYLVPRAATLLTEISRAFIDSLASKGIPFHKLLVTSVLRTRHDVERLRRINHNASEQSCHQYGTTFDISYNHFVRVMDPDGPELPQTWGVTLKSVLAEVLEDQREMGTCYVKYEYKQSCFHITAR